MADLPTEGFISTPDLAIDNIELETDSYSIVDASPGAMSWTRETVEAPWVHGRTLISARKNIVTTFLAIRIYGATHLELHENLADLLRAVEQRRYRLGLTIGGVPYEWYCEPADYRPAGDRWDKFGLMVTGRRQQVYEFEIPRRPTPITGAH